MQRRGERARARPPARPEGPRVFDVSRDLTSGTPPPPLLRERGRPAGRPRYRYSWHSAICFVTE